MKVVILGIPGSGKSELATALAEQIVEEKLTESLAVVDRYAEELSDNLNVYVGMNASYIPHVMISIAREVAERNCERQGIDTITCGSILDSLAHLAVRVEILAQSPKTDLRDRHIYKEMSGANLLATMIEDVWRYNRAYYLAPPAGWALEIPGQDRTEIEYALMIDNALQVGIAKWGLVPPYFKELSGTVDEMVEVILADLKEEYESDSRSNRNNGSAEEASSS